MALGLRVTQGWCRAATTRLHALQGVGQRQGELRILGVRSGQQGSSAQGLLRVWLGSGSGWSQPLDTTTVCAQARITLILGGRL